MKLADVVFDALKQIQTEGAASNFAIISRAGDSPSYVQIAAANGEPGCYLEASAATELSDRQRDQLAALGWNEPTTSPNFAQEANATSDGERRDIADLLARTLKDVYGASLREGLEVQVTLE